MSSRRSAALAATPPPSDQEELTKEVSRLVTRITGVQLGQKQAAMVQNRVRKRIFALKLDSERAYLDYLRTHEETEATALVSLLTTHHTYFFRENVHFEFLEKEALATLVAAKRQRGDRTLRIWSAACSRGQEAYSLSMLLAHYLPKLAPDFSYEILGTDVDPESVAIAKNGVYSHREIQEAPLVLLGDHWSKGRGEISGYVKARPTIKRACHFRVGNLFDIPSLPENQKFDIIFCRNVFIYFDSQQIKQISEKLFSSLSPDGYLFVGISETLKGLGLPLSVAGPSIYRHAKAGPIANVTPIRPAEAPPVAKTAPLRVLSVDDSPVIQLLLKKILVPEHGFEVTATAENGRVALNLLQTQTFDVITLDIHMPEMNGLELLASLQGKAHPPIVMLSSVSREDADLALRCLDAGAVDYIEKPVLSGLVERSEEIRTKLKYAAELRAAPIAALSLERALARGEATIPQPEKKRRIILAGLADRERVLTSLREMRGPQPPTIVLMEGSGAGLLALQGRYATALPGFRLVFPESSSPHLPQPNELIFIDQRGYLEASCRAFPPEAISVLVFGHVTPKLIHLIQSWPGAQILLDETDARRGVHPARQIASDIVPSTSFAYLSHEFFVRRPR